ncbi:extradiol ring-cleavage dioxygenase [Bacillus infantis]|uniref:DODA-type extradiol aromatic ring-opening family dioxygenase n=1 Tax=Bacillus infantis TaxID=324767 RepID=UPI003CF3D849
MKNRSHEGKRLMNPFVFACITPHGGEIIPELQGEKPDRMEKTRKSMERLGALMDEARPDSLIVLTPHGTRINGQFSVAVSERLEGEAEENEASFRMERKTDLMLASSILAEAEAGGLPAAGINYGTSAGPLSCLPLDWGAIVPLRFMPEVPVVVITPSREITYEQHIAFGKAIRKAAGESGRKAGLIASCDWSHTHDSEGPYGYHPAAEELDRRTAELIESGRLEDLALFDPELVENAKPDGIWQTLILAGAIPQEERDSRLLSFEAPTYFGLICAAYYQNREAIEND